MNGGVQLQHDLRAFGFAVLIGQQDRNGAVCRSGTDNPRDGFDGFPDSTPSISLNGLFGLVQKAFHMGPMFLNQVAKALLFLNFL